MSLTTTYVVEDGDYLLDKAFGPGADHELALHRIGTEAAPRAVPEDEPEVELSLQPVS